MGFGRWYDAERLGPYPVPMPTQRLHAGSDVGSPQALKGHAFRYPGTLELYGGVQL